MSDTADRGQILLDEIERTISEWRKSTGGEMPELCSALGWACGALLGDVFNTAGPGPLEALLRLSCEARDEAIRQSTHGQVRLDSTQTRHPSPTLN